MKRKHFPVRFLSLWVAAAGFVGCGSERIDANISYLSDGNAPASAKGTWLEIIFGPDSSFADGRELRVRIDGHWMLISPEEPSYVTIPPNIEFGRMADNLVSAAHIYQLVDPDGRVLLTTAPLDLSAGRANQIVVYGNSDKLDYYFFANTDAELAAIPSDSALARVINLRSDRAAFPVRTCPVPSDPATITTLTDCGLAADSLAYGQIWQAIVPRATNLGVACDPPASSDLCNLQLLGRGCYVPPQYTSKTPAQITLIALRAANAFFTGNEFPIGDNCY